MRPNPTYAVADERVVRELISENPWATIVSQGEYGPIASHYPVLLDQRPCGLAVLTHVGRPDEQRHDFAGAEILLIVAGPHGYISPSWYVQDDTPVPTWNFSVAHCYGVPEILDEAENLQVLTRLVEHFERHVRAPVQLDQARGAQMARGTVGIRLAITRFECKMKMSQDKDPGSRRRVLEALRADGPYANPRLADEMQRALGAGEE